MNKDLQTQLQYRCYHCHLRYSIVRTSLVLPRQYVFHVQYNNGVKLLMPQVTKVVMKWKCYMQVGHCNWLSCCVKTKKWGWNFHHEEINKLIFRVLTKHQLCYIFTVEIWHLSTCFIPNNNFIHEKISPSDWLRAVQFFFFLNSAEKS